VISVSGPISSSRYEPPDTDPEFIKNVEGELSRRLGQPVTLVLGDGIIAVRADNELFAGESVVVTEVGPLLRRKRAVEWADALERKTNQLSRRAEDVRHLYAEIQRSPSPEKTGAIVLEHVDDYDDDFFNALGMMISRDKARLHLSRASKFETLREYLRMVRRRASDGETAAMWSELAQGAAQEKALNSDQR
jgi:hypothetical protein